MIDNWIDFTLSVVGGATAFLCLFEGTRRLGAYGVHRKAVLMTVLAAAICVLYGGFAYWKYADMKATLSVSSQRKPASMQLPANWGRGLSPERREIVSLANARWVFMGSGTLASYIDRNGEIKSFAPTQEDLIGRERVVAYYSQAEYTARGNLAEAVLWLIMGLLAVLFGFAMSFEKAPPPASPSGELDEQSGGMRSSA
jgi:hypothetical protein